MIIPFYLKPGDRIRIVSPAGKINKEKLIAGINLLKNEGFEIVVGNHIFGNHFQFSSTDQDRLSDLQEAMDDGKCKAIVCARGGYGSVRIADQLDFSSIKKNPKWLIGFSDITVLHCLFQKHGIASIHGTMPGFYLKDRMPTESFTSLIQILKGETQSFQIVNHKLNRNGTSKGHLIGGNLSILYSLLGTKFESETKGKILFIEDTSEYLYHLDRIMHSFKLAGKLEDLTGLLVGSFSEMKDNDPPFGQTVEEIILNAVKEYNFPVCFDFPVGHIERNLPLVIGGEYEMNVSDQTSLHRTQ